MSIQETLADLNSRIAEYQGLKSSIVGDLKKDFPSFIEKVLLHGEFPFLEVRGYTPGLNDGDPCEFGLHIDLSYGFEEYIGSFQDAFEDVDFSNLEHLTWEFMSVNSDVKNRGTQIQNIFYGLEEILQDALDGNFQILAAFDVDGKFHCKIDTDYECGY